MATDYSGRPAEHDRFTLNYNHQLGTHEVMRNGVKHGEIDADHLKEYAWKHLNTDGSAPLTPSGAGFAQLKAEALAYMDWYNKKHPAEPLRIDEAFTAVARKPYNSDLVREWRKSITVKGMV